jgi:SAM-dependent methyltransferase
VDGRAKTDCDSGRVSAAIYEPFLWLGERRGMRFWRSELLAKAKGRVLELGAGTGLNLPLYPETVDELVLTEPDRWMAARINAQSSPVERTDVTSAPAEELPFDSDSFDTVVSTLVLCTVPDPEAALAEVRRVLRPGGRLLFCEHVLADSPWLARWQGRLAGPWAAFAAGCRCDRRTVDSIADALELVRVEKAKWRGMPAIVHPLAIGEARA